MALYDAVLRHRRYPQKVHSVDVMPNRVLLGAVQIWVGWTLWRAGWRAKQRCTDS